MSISQMLFSFEGRMLRSKFWLVVAPLIVLDIVLRVELDHTDNIVEIGLILLLGLSTMWIGLAAYAKRWHDLNRSGVMTLLMLIPLFNILVFLYLGFAPGTSGTNKYDNGVV